MVVSVAGQGVLPTETVAPRKQCVTALKKRMFLVMESPTIRVVGGKRGRGDADSGLTGLGDGRVDFEEYLTGDGEVKSDGRAERRTGAQCGAGVNCSKERQRDPREEECSGFTGGGIRVGGLFLDCWVDGGEVGASPAKRGK